MVNKRSSALLSLVVSVGPLSACGTTFPSAGARANKGQCPNLTGTFVEEGTSIQNGEPNKSPAHLTWLIGGDKVRSATKPLNTAPAPGKPSTYFVRTVRISQPAPDRFTLEAFDAENSSLGVFAFGPEDGWQCDRGAFIVTRASTGGSEGTWGDATSVHKVYRGNDGSLIRSIHDEYQQRSVFLLGGPVGEKKVLDVEYRFARASQVT